MKRLSLILALSMLSACAPKDEPHNPLVCDAAFSPAVSQFQSDSVKIKGVAQSLENLTIEFSAPGALLSQREAAVCDQNGGIKTIQVDPIWWSSHDEIYQKNVIYHELGHCVLGRGHRNDILDGMHYASLMNSYSYVNDAFYLDNEKYYINELFN